MKLEQQVCSLEYAKRLKELGVGQESLFWWVEYTDGHGKEESWSVENNRAGYKQFISAFTVAELGEMLPNNVNKYHWRGNKTDKGKAYEIKYRRLVNHKLEVLRIKRDVTEANARAKMLIYLLENNLITL